MKIKKLIAVCLCAGMTAALCGCSLGNILEKFTSTGDLSAEAPPVEEAPAKSGERIYIDELTGKLDSFTGSALTLSVDDATYVFDVS